MNFVQIEIVKRCRVNGGMFLLPGARLEFVRSGSASGYVNQGFARIVKPNKKRVHVVDSDQDSGTSDKAGDT